MNRQQRHNRVRTKIFGTKKRPRVSVFRSNRGMNVQLVDDDSRQTLVSVNHILIKKYKNKTDQAHLLGLLLAKKATKKKIKKVVFDRGGYKYHGRVKALAQGARQGGLEF